MRSAQFSLCLLKSEIETESATSNLRLGGIAQLVERQLCKLDVRSSNLLASTIFKARNLNFISVCALRANPSSPDVSKLQ